MVRSGLWSMHHGAPLHDQPDMSYLGLSPTGQGTLDSGDNPGNVHGQRRSNTIGTHRQRHACGQAAIDQVALRGRA